jgi:hypothetical protein
MHRLGWPVRLKRELSVYASEEVIANLTRHAMGKKLLGIKSGPLVNTNDLLPLQEDILSFSYLMEIHCAGKKLLSENRYRALFQCMERRTFIFLAKNWGELYITFR